MLLHDLDVLLSGGDHLFGSKNKSSAIRFTRSKIREVDEPYLVLWFGVSGG